MGHGLNPREREAGAAERGDALPHQLLEIPHVPCRQVELGEGKLFAQVGPDLGGEDAFKVDRGDHCAGS